MKALAVVAVAGVALAVSCSSSEVAKSGAQPVPSSNSALQAHAEAIFTRALEDSRAIVQLRDLVTAAPKRLSGSKGYDDAVAFAAARLREIGCDEVRTEPVLVPHWVRGEETAMVTKPEPMTLRVTALGGSVPTASGGIEAEVVMVKSFEQLQQLGEQARGKIVFFNRAMPRAFLRTFQAYGDAVPQRSNGAVEAAKVGAIAAIVRSMTTSIDGYPHTGAMRYADGVEKVPAAAIATEDAEALARMLAESKTPVKVKLVLGCRSEPDVMSHNVVAEIRGSERPDEVIVLGGHLDAWDLGEGAHDDGAGCAQTIEAMRLLVACGIKPKRTVRAVLFANEENGLRGGVAYDAAHASERHMGAIETDSGGATPFGFSCTVARENADPYRALLAPLASYGCDTFVPGGGGGADIGPLAARGVPCFGLITDSQRYFDYHHSARDVVASVNERELALGAAAVAYLAVALADR